jgi:hypothetical protein
MAKKKKREKKRPSLKYRKAKNQKLRKRKLEKYGDKKISDLTPEELEKAFDLATEYVGRRYRYGQGKKKKDGRKERKDKGIKRGKRKEMTVADLRKRAKRLGIRG